jgi:hypothetical protein
VVVFAAAILWLLVTRLRAESLVGAYGEIDEYLSPSFEWPRVRFYLRMLADGPGLLPLAALAGAALALRWRRPETAILWLALLPAFVHAAFLIPRGPQERYGLTLVLVIAVLAAQGARWVADALAPIARERGWGGAEATDSARSRSIAPDSARTPRKAPGTTWVLLQAPVIAGALMTVALLAHQDVARAIDRAALSPNEGSWLRRARELGIGRDTIVMTDLPTTVGWYIGDLDFWVSSRDFEKYTSRTDDVRRDVHTGAVLVRSRGDFERLVNRPLAGRQVWVIASGRSYQWGELVDDDLKTALDRTASQRINPGDNFRLLLLNLPSGS